MSLSRQLDVFVKEVLEDQPKVDLKPACCMMNSEYGVRYRVAGYRRKVVWVYYVKTALLTASECEEAGVHLTGEHWLVSTHGVQFAPFWMKRPMETYPLQLVYCGPGSDLSIDKDIRVPIPAPSNGK